MQEQSIKVTVHNTWTQIGETQVIKLRSPNQFGEYESDVPIVTLSNYFNNEYTALMFELEFIV